MTFSWSTSLTVKLTRTKILLAVANTKYLSEMLNLSRAVVRSFATSGSQRAAKAEIDKGYFEIKKIQDHFQKHDGKPVHLKGGALDQVLYRITVALSLVGIGGMAKLYYELAVPKRD